MVERRLWKLEDESSSLSTLTNFNNREKKMINQYLYHPLSEIRGFVDAVNVHPDGKSIARIEDHWFFIDELIAG